MSYILSINHDVTNNGIEVCYKAKSQYVAAATAEIYERILSMADVPKAPDNAYQMYINRCRNYLPFINEVVTYPEFNRGRVSAFLQYYQCRIDQLHYYDIPVATCVGTYDHDIIVVAMFSKHKPTYINNKYQTRPEYYPEKYGPVPPLFSRGAIINNRVIVAGTASIFGSRTVCIDDFAGQVRKTIDNISIILRSATAISERTISLSDMIYRVYLPTGCNTMTKRSYVCNMLPTNRVWFFTNELCRTDLLVEIEAEEYNG